MNIITCIDKSNAIGKDGDLLYRITEDLKRFKLLTTNCTVVMGRKTFESLGNKPLPDRINIVLTSNTKIDDPDVIVAHDTRDVLKYDVYGNRPMWIIGGARVYEEFMPFTKHMYLTIVDRVSSGDTVKFPEIRASEWEETYASEYKYDEDKDLRYKFVVYTKIG